MGVVEEREAITQLLERYLAGNKEINAEVTANDGGHTWYQWRV